MQLVAVVPNALQQLGLHQFRLGITKGAAFHQLLILPPAGLHQLPRDHGCCHRRQQNRQLLGWLTKRFPADQQRLHHPKPGAQLRVGLPQSLGFRSLGLQISQQSRYAQIALHMQPRTQQNQGQR